MGGLWLHVGRGMRERGGVWALGSSGGRAYEGTVGGAGKGCLLQRLERRLGWRLIFSPVPFSLTVH